MGLRNRLKRVFRKSPVSGGGSKKSNNKPKNAGSTNASKQAKANVLNAGRRAAALAATSPSPGGGVMPFIVPPFRRVNARAMGLVGRGKVSAGVPVYWPSGGSPGALMSPRYSPGVMLQSPGSGGFSPAPYGYGVPVSGSPRSGSPSTSSSSSSSTGAYYIHIPGKMQGVVEANKLVNVPAGAMFAKVGDVIAYSHKDPGNSEQQQWLGRVKRLQKDGVIVEQRGYFERVENVGGQTVKLPQEQRNIRISRFKRVLPKNVSAYEDLGYAFSHHDANAGGNGGSKANRALLRKLSTNMKTKEQYIAFEYQGKPVFGKIAKIDMRTGEIHMQTKPDKLYNQQKFKNRIAVPMPGKNVKIKFKPTANSTVNSLGPQVNDRVRKILKGRGYQNLNQGFRLNTSERKNANANFLNKKVLGDDHTILFNEMNGDIDWIESQRSTLPPEKLTEYVTQFIFQMFPVMEKINYDIYKQGASKQKKEVVAKLINGIHTRVQKLFFGSSEEYNALVEKAHEVFEATKNQSGGIMWYVRKVKDYLQAKVSQAAGAAASLLGFA